PSWMAPPSPAATLLRNRLLATTSVPRLFSSAKPPPAIPDVLFARVLLKMVTALGPAFPMPPPGPVRAWLLLITAPDTVSVADCTGEKVENAEMPVSENKVKVTVGGRS